MERGKRIALQGIEQAANDVAQAAHDALAMPYLRSASDLNGNLRDELKKLLTRARDAGVGI